MHFGRQKICVYKLRFQNCKIRQFWYFNFCPKKNSYQIKKHMIQRANGSGPKCDVCIKKQQKLIALFATW